MFEQFNKETLARAMENANRADKEFKPNIGRLTPNLAKALTELVKLPQMGKGKKLIKGGKK